MRDDRERLMDVLEAIEVVRAVFARDLPLLKCRISDILAGFDR